MRNHKWFGEFFVLGSLAWALLLGAALVWALQEDEQKVTALAYAEAKTAHDRDVSLRRWVTAHGGIYVPLTPDQQPVPWLEHVPERDVVTTSGVRLTLINPGTIARQLNDDEAKSRGIRVRATALKYLNPQNAPDIWEKRQLESFARRERTEIMESTEIGGRPYLRYLKALVMEPGCEKCHAAPGFQSGEPSGATGVNLPLSPYADMLAKTRANLMLTYGAIWLLGTLGIASLYRSARARVREHAESQAIINFSDDAIISTTPEGIVKAWNQGAEKIFGYASSEAIGRSVEFLIPPDQASVARDMMARVRQGASVDHYETLRNHKSGRRIDVSTSVSPIFDESGNVIGVSEIARDITQRNRMFRESALQQERLERLVEQRTESLSKALDDARHADQTKDAFLATISHELRTPLNAVIGLAGLARGDIDGAKRADYLDKITASGRHLNRIINDLLDLSKISAGKLEFERVGFRLRDLVANGLSVMAHRIAAKGLVLQQNISPELPDIYLGDPARIEQILLNLVGNAIKFTEAGSIDVSVTAREKSEGRVCLCMSVSDTGVGMSEDVLRRVFEPFAQADASISRKHGGTGLGLPICHQLARMMGGEIRVTSQPGVGSRFSVDLWLDVGDTSDLVGVAVHSGEALPAAYRGARVLVVEDQQMNRDVVAGLLASVGISPTYAGDGAEALVILREAGPAGIDLVLMDVQMPVLDGLAATREIRSWAGFSSLPIVGMTAHTMEHEKQACLAAGMSEHMAKPIDCDEFFRMLAKFLPVGLQVMEKDVSAVSPERGEASPMALASVPGLDVTDGLARFSAKEDRYRHWLGDFVATGELSVGKVREAVLAGDAETAAKAAHALKGRVGMLGMKELHAAVSALEAALRAAEPVEELLASVRESVAQMCARLADALAGRQPEPEPAPSPPAAPERPPAERIQWHESYSVGVSHLDEQHKKLVALINTFGDAQRDGKTQDFHEMLTEMFNYTQEHFAAEESYMEKIGYPKLDEHIKEHSRFIDKVASVSLASFEGKEDIVGVHEFLKKWLLGHILHSDMDYRHFSEGCR